MFTKVWKENLSSALDLAEPISETNQIKPITGYFFSQCR
jgi:hypothetical protein